MKKSERLEQERITKDKEYKKKQKHTDGLDREYRIYRQEVNSMTPEKKAERLGIFNLLYWGLTNNHKMPEDIKKQAIEIQTKFFKENPKRIYCSPFLFKKLFTDFQIFNPAFVMIERAVLEDVKSVKYS